jgi:tetratricopeptide (TPR) repeat protein
MADNASSMLDTGQISLETYLATAGPVIDKALELDDQLPEAHAQKAFFQWHSGDSGAAEESLKHALSLKPGYSPTLALYGKYLRWTNRPREAIPLLEKVLRDDPLSIEILFDLAKSEMYAGHPEKAIQYSEKMRQIDPDSVHSYVSAMQAYMWMGRYDLAWPFFAKNVALDPGDYETWGHIAMYWQHLGDPGLSDLYMEHAAALGPRSPAVLKCKVSILADREQFGEALTISRQALEDGLDDRWFSNSIFLRTLRDNALETRNFESARNWYLDVHPELFEDPPDVTSDNIIAAADLVLLLQRSGEPEQADTLNREAMAWYEATQPATSHGFLTSIVDVSLLALNGDRDSALNRLRQAVEQGWKFDWPWHWANKNLDSIRDDPVFTELENRMNTETAEQLAAIRALPDNKQVMLNP